MHQHTYDRLAKQSTRLMVGCDSRYGQAQPKYITQFYPISLKMLSRPSIAAAETTALLGLVGATKIWKSLCNVITGHLSSILSLSSVNPITATTRARQA